MSKVIPSGKLNESTEIQKNPTEPEKGDVEPFFNIDKILINSTETFNFLSRIIIYFSSIIIFEKFLKQKLLKIQMKTVNESNVRGKFLELIFKEFWYIPIIIFLYNIFIILFVYVMYFFMYILIHNQNQALYRAQRDTPVKNKEFLFNYQILIEILSMCAILVPVNIIILLVLYLLIINIFDEEIKDGNKISENFIKQFYSYYKFAYYSSLLFIFILFQKKGLSNLSKSV